MEVAVAGRRRRVVHAAEEGTADDEGKVSKLYEQIGRLKMELEWLTKSCPLQ